MSDDLNSSPIQIVAKLWVVEGRRDLFIEYETRALKIMSKYGGKLISATIIQDPSDINSPNEIHLLEFPSLKSFEKYRLDGELNDLSDMRSNCIGSTEILIGQSNQILVAL